MINGFMIRANKEKNMEQELVNAVLALNSTEVELPKKKFVVFIDTQVDFMVEGSALYVTGAEPLISKLNHFAYHLTPENVAGVLFTFDTHMRETYDSMPESAQFPLHCEVATPGWHNVVNPHIVNRQLPLWTLVKGVFNMWEEPNLFLEQTITDPILIANNQAYGISVQRDEFFDNLKNNGIDTVVIVGVAADFCVKWAADGFLARGFNVEIPRSMTAGIVRDIDAVAAEDYNGANLTITD
jgi:nicotinamidase/pyrazinamidase